MLAVIPVSTDNIPEFRHAGTIILKLTYDYDVQQKDDPLVHLADEGNSRLMLATQGGLHLVDVFPICEFMNACCWAKYKLSNLLQCNTYLHGFQAQNFDV